MEGVLKVGFSLKDPVIRSVELDGTGLPFRWQVEYFVFVDEPYIVEQRVHSELNYCHVSKEFFKLEITSAIVVIHKVIKLLNYSLYFEECDFEKHKEADKETTDTKLPETQINTRVHKSSLNTFDKKTNINKPVQRTTYDHKSKNDLYKPPGYVIKKCPNCQYSVKFNSEIMPPKGSQWICPICKTKMFPFFEDDDCFLLSPQVKLIWIGARQKYELSAWSSFIVLEQKFIDILKLCSRENNVKYIVFNIINKDKEITTYDVKYFLSLALNKMWICKIKG